jgi:hypothetical protein
MAFPPDTQPNTAPLPLDGANLAVPAARSSLATENTENTEAQARGGPQRTRSSVFSGFSAAKFT